MGPLADAAGALNAYLLAQLEKAMDDPRDDLLGAYAPRVHAGDMTAEDVIGAFVILVGAGGESTAGLIGNSARMLAERPALQDELRADPELVPRFLEEVLRLESPFRGHYRHVRHDTELGGVPLAGGDHLFLLWSSANRDPLEHEDADELRLDRKYASSHLAFGRGLHFCLGAPLARLEARCAIDSLARAHHVVPARPRHAAGVAAVGVRAPPRRAAPPTRPRLIGSAVRAARRAKSD